MYNTELKTRFLQEYSSSAISRHVASGFFEKVSGFEQALGKDLCAMTPDELGQLSSHFGGVRNSTGSLTWLRVLRAYSAWCVESGVPGAMDAASRMTLDFSANARQQMVSSPEHLLAVLGALFGDCQYDIYPSVISNYLWFGFSGLPELDAVNITIDDIDISGMMIRYGGREYPLYRESVGSIVSCVRAQRSQQFGSGYILDAPTGHKSIKRLRGLLSDRIHRFGAPQSVPDLSYSRVWLSGAFYRIHEREVSGFPAEFSIDNMSDDLRHKLEESTANKTSAYLWRFFKQYRDDYLAWKQAFYPNTP